MTGSGDRYGMRTTLMVQTFEIHRKRLRPGNRDVAPTETGALKLGDAPEDFAGQVIGE